MLMDWSMLDTWIVITAALAAMGCALPGAFLLLRRQSLMGDALSHSVLPGIVLAYLAVDQLQHAGWWSTSTALAWRHPMLFLGAAATAILSGALSELLARAGRLDANAALGVVYTAMFAAGLLLIRLAADAAHIDPGCVLYGNLETIVTDTIGQTQIPRAVVVNGVILLLNIGGLLLSYKELQLCTFDPALATALGIPANLVQQLLLAATGATVVAAFESVGSILVIAMLVVPPACGVLLSDRLSGVLGFSLLIAALSAVFGHVGALVLPDVIRWTLAWPELGDISTAGMMSVAGGAAFLGCWLLAPRHGLVRQWRDHQRLQRRILSEDILGALYRIEELVPNAAGELRAKADLAAALSVSPGRLEVCLQRLKQRGELEVSGATTRLTPTGRQAAQNLVRSHRLWESYLAHHFHLELPRLHASAEQVEHFLDPQLREELAEELQQPGRDPHGSLIPPSGSF